MIDLLDRYGIFTSDTPVTDKVFDFQEETDNSKLLKNQSKPSKTKKIKAGLSNFFNTERTTK